MKLLKFEADWCSPCSQQSALLEDFDTVPIRIVDVEEDAEFANDWSVRGLPTLVLVDEGTEIERWTGVTQVEEIESAIESFNTDSNQ